MIPIANQPLYKNIQENLRNKIHTGKLRPGDLVPSEKDLGKQFNVSQLTARNAISGLVEEGLVHRIQGKGTFVNETVTSASPDNHIIGVVLPTMETPIEQFVVNYLEYYLSKLGFHLLLNISRESVEKESEIIERFCSMGVSGLIIFPAESENYNEKILQLSIERFPLVLIDRYLKNARTPSVTANNIQGAFIATNYLLDKGCENIGLLSPEFSNTATLERKEGLEKSLLERGLLVNHHMWCMISLDDITDNDKVYSQILNFLKSHKNLDGLFSVNAHLTNLLYHCLCELNMQETVSVVGFDRPNIANIPYIQQDIQTMCKEASTLLAKQIKEPGFMTKQFIDVELIEKPALFPARLSPNA